MIAKWGGALLLLAFSASACSLGMGRVREAAANSEPKPIGCEQFLARPPLDTWVILKGAGGTLRDSAIRSSSGKANRIYVPLTCGGSGPIRVLLATEDPALLAAVAAKQDVAVTRDMKGMVRKASQHETKVTSGPGLSRTIPNLALDYVVVEEGSSPSFLIGAVWLVGAVVGYSFLWKVLRS